MTWKTGHSDRWMQFIINEGYPAPPKLHVFELGRCIYCGHKEKTMSRIIKDFDCVIPPRIVCLCGSTRFYEYFQKANFEETMKGNIVLSVGFYPHAQEKAHGEDLGVTPEQKIKLDELHKRKIDLADEVLILNVDGYIGNSTRSEMQYAMMNGKIVRFLEPNGTERCPVCHSSDRKRRNKIYSDSSLYDERECFNNWHNE
jgi:hypothetical protein